ncbi:VOC family protein [Microbacterium sp. Sa4CUA7]|uniref:VOC family protein n=1 Tax=Microbacterium pullorum TaxID=2762236 RepID=A0ABR8S3E7_9MICO|nr:VOC family protein [Microbacterium pullorum]MBD7957997.1 VOC family protein [Microbacterium pullorum]
MQQRISLVTLGVVDLDRSVAFYRALGWEPHPSSVPGEIVFYEAGGMVLGLWSRDELARDSGRADAGGWGGITLAHNVREEAEVDAVLRAAQEAGGAVVRAAAATPWGGYCGVFADPDGHPWEIAVNPGWPLRPDGSVRLA